VVHESGLFDFFRVVLVDIFLLSTDAHRFLRKIQADVFTLRPRICVYLCSSVDNLFLQKILYYSVKADQNPKEFYDEGGEIEIKEKRNNYQTGADGVQHGIKQTLAADFFELEKNVGRDYYPDTDTAD
jgi:hypothetical protein